MTPRAQSNHIHQLNRTHHLAQQKALAEQDLTIVSVPAVEPVSVDDNPAGVVDLSAYRRGA